MSWLDIIILLPLLIGLVRGLMRGLIQEISSIVAILLGFLGSRLWGASFAVWLMQQFAWSETICMVLAYALLFIGIALTLNILAKLLSKLFQKIALGWLNRLLGAIFGIGKWAIVVLALVLCVHRLDNQFHFLQEDLKNKSVLYMKAAPLSEKMWNKLILQIQQTQRNNNQESTAN
jgi:membrane protein required for colicin V production